MLAFRRGHPALLSGGIEFLDSGGDMLAFVRAAADDQLLCLFNFGGKAAIWSVPYELRGRIAVNGDPGAASIRLGGLSSFFVQIG
jgi:alpha-glucosidase